MSADLQTTLVQLFEQVQRDPGTLPAIPLDEWQAESGEWRLLKSFHAMLERLYQRQQEQREKQDRFALAAQSANDGLWVWHLTTNTAFFSPQ